MLPAAFLLWLANLLTFSLAHIAASCALASHDLTFALATVGMAAGAATAGRLSDRLGRKRTARMLLSLGAAVAVAAAVVHHDDSVILLVLATAAAVVAGGGHVLYLFAVTALPSGRGRCRAALPAVFPVLLLPVAMVQRVFEALPVGAALACALVAVFSASIGLLLLPDDEVAVANLVAATGGPSPRGARLTTDGEGGFRLADELDLEGGGAAGGQPVAATTPAARALRRQRFVLPAHSGGALTRGPRRSRTHSRSDPETATAAALQAVILHAFGGGRSSGGAGKPNNSEPDPSSSARPPVPGVPPRAGEPATEAEVGGVSPPQELPPPRRSRHGSAGTEGGSEAGLMGDDEDGIDSDSDDAAHMLGVVRGGGSDGAIAARVVGEGGGVQRRSRCCGACCCGCNWLPHKPTAAASWCLLAAVLFCASFTFFTPRGEPLFGDHAACRWRFAAGAVGMVAVGNASTAAAASGGEVADGCGVDGVAATFESGAHLIAGEVVALAVLAGVLLLRGARRLHTLLVTAAGVAALSLLAAAAAFPDAPCDASPGRAASEFFVHGALMLAAHSAMAQRVVTASFATAGRQVGMYIAVYRLAALLTVLGGLLQADSVSVLAWTTYSLQHRGSMAALARDAGSVPGAARGILVACACAAAIVACLTAASRTASDGDSPKRLLLALTTTVRAAPRPPVVLLSPTSPLPSPPPAVRLPSTPPPRLPPPPFRGVGGLPFATPGVLARAPRLPLATTAGALSPVVPSAMDADGAADDADADELDDVPWEEVRAVGE